MTKKSAKSLKQKRAAKRTKGAKPYRTRRWCTPRTAEAQRIWKIEASALIQTKIGDGVRRSLFQCECAGQNQLTGLE